MDNIKYTTKIVWKKKLIEIFSDNKYSRDHEWEFDGGAKVFASSSSQVIPTPMSNDAAIDPEEALVASASSCHMLWFLHLAGKQKFVIEEYKDNAVGIMNKNENGKMAITHITLSPKVTFDKDNQPSREQIKQLHYLAHEDCYIANSIRATFEIITQE